MSAEDLLIEQVERNFKKYLNTIGSKEYKKAFFKAEKILNHINYIDKKTFDIFISKLQNYQKHENFKR